MRSLQAMRGDQEGLQEGLGSHGMAAAAVPGRPPGKGAQDEGPAGKLQERLRGEQVVKHLQW